MESSIAELAKYRYETCIEAIEDAKIMFERRINEVTEAVDTSWWLATMVAGYNLL